MTFISLNKGYHSQKRKYTILKFVLEFETTLDALLNFYVSKAKEIYQIAIDKNRFLRNLSLFLSPSLSLSHFLYIFSVH